MFVFRLFNETPVNPRKCTAVLAKILYLINQGETLGTTEATECFFAITKLFQARDTVLRRLVYLGIKELSGIAEDVIIVTSSWKFPSPVSTSQPSQLS